MGLTLFPHRRQTPSLTRLSLRRALVASGEDSLEDLASDILDTAGQITGCALPRPYELWPEARAHLRGIATAAILLATDPAAVAVAEWAALKAGQDAGRRCGLPLSDERQAAAFDAAVLRAVRVFVERLSSGIAEGPAVPK